MFLPASPPLCPCLPERGSAGPTGRPRPRAEASDSWPSSQPQVTSSLALPLPRGLLSLLGELGGGGAPLPHLSIAWESLGVRIQPALDLETM